MCKIAPNANKVFTVLQSWCLDLNFMRLKLSQGSQFCFMLDPLVLYSCYGLEATGCGMLWVTFCLPPPSLFQMGSLFLELIFFKAVIYGMSCSILLNCKENILNYLSFDVIYINWLTSSNPSHIIQIISSSYNYAGTIKKGKLLVGVVWLSFGKLIFFLIWGIGDISCFVRWLITQSPSEWCDQFPTTSYCLVLFPHSSFLSVNLFSTLLAFIALLLWFLLCAMQGYPLLLPVFCSFLLRAQNLVTSQKK